MLKYKKIVDDIRKYYIVVNKQIDHMLMCEQDAPNDFVNDAHWQKIKHDLLVEQELLENILQGGLFND